MAASRARTGWRAGLLRATAWVTRDRARARRIQLLAALLAFQGAAFVLVSNPHANPAVFWLGAALIPLGAFLLLAPEIERALLRAHERPARGRAPTKKPAEATIAERAIARLTGDGQYDRLLPLVGCAVVAFDLLYNKYLTPSPKLTSSDFAVLGLGATLIAFPFVPASFTRERSFLLFFFASLSLVFGVPLLALRADNSAYANVDQYTAALVTPQLAGVLGALGMNVGYSGNDLYYPDLTTGNMAATVHIATECSGLYSMGIFMAAFAALVVSEYPRLSWRVGGLLGAGILCAYLANLLRMVVIIEAGHNWGAPALLWTHANLGDLIFLMWVAPFVWVTYRALDPAAEAPGEFEADGFESALRRQGIDPSSIGEDDWFCASCFTRVEAPAGKGPDRCPACGASLA